MTTIPKTCPWVGRGSGLPCGLVLHDGLDEEFAAETQKEWWCLAGHRIYASVPLPDVDAYGRPRRRGEVRTPRLTAEDRALLADLMTEPYS